jgi:CD109 antigen
MPAVSIPPASVNVSSQDLAEVQRIRQFFPETWIWDTVKSATNGKAYISTTVPDTITTWMLRAIALSKDKGLGVAESQLTVFQAFFLTVDLPYSAIRGEEFPVSVAVYNYLDQPQSVVVEIEPDSWFDLLDSSQKTIDIQANDIGSAKFKIRPTQLVLRE